MDAGHTGKTKGNTRDHTRHNEEKPRGDKMTISEQKYQELKDERVAHFADKTKIKLILSLRTHRGTLTKILGHLAPGLALIKYKIRLNSCSMFESYFPTKNASFVYFCKM